MQVCYSIWILSESIISKWKKMQFGLPQVILFKCAKLLEIEHFLTRQFKFQNNFCHKHLCIKIWYSIWNINAYADEKVDDSTAASRQTGSLLTSTPKKARRKLYETGNAENVRKDCGDARRGTKHDLTHTTQSY